MWMKSLSGSYDKLWFKTELALIKCEHCGNKASWKSLGIKFSWKTIRDSVDTGNYLFPRHKSYLLPTYFFHKHITLAVNKLFHQVWKKCEDSRLHSSCVTRGRYFQQSVDTGTYTKDIFICLRTGDILVSVY